MREYNSFNTEIPDGLYSAWNEYERLLPNFASKYVRSRCLKLVQDDERYKKQLKEEREKKPKSIVLQLMHEPKKFESNQNTVLLVNEQCNRGSCFCEKLTPMKEPNFMVVLIVDVSDFSGKMDRLDTTKAVAINSLESFSKATKRYFDGIVQIVLSYGGDIIKFSGDSIIVCWRLDKEYLSTGEKTAQEEAVFRCCKCAITLLRIYGEYVLDNNNETFEIDSFKIHLSAGAGIGYDINVGTKHSRWEHLLGGDLIKKLGKYLGHAKGGELSITKETFDILKNVILLSKESFVINTPDYIIINKNASVEYTKQNLPLSIESVIDMWESVSGRMGQNLYKNYISTSAIYKLEMDILQSGTFYDNSKLSDLLGFYELREAVTLFIFLPYLDDWSLDKTLEDAQKTIEVVNLVNGTFGGVIRQFSYDDKGANILLFFGIPPSTSIKCIYNAVAAAVAIKERLVELSLFPAIGIAHGTVFISGVGNSVRTEYCALGSSINLAARLMCHEAARGEIICDSKTYDASKRNFCFETIKIKKSIKGFTGITHIYKLIKSIYNKPASFSLIPITKANNIPNSIIGHKHECKIIEKTINGELKRKCTIIFAERDQGLTTLFRYTFFKIKTLNIESVNITCRNVEGFKRLFVANMIVKRICSIVKNDDKKRKEDSDLKKDKNINHFLNLHQTCSEFEKNVKSQNKLSDINSNNITDSPDSKGTPIIEFPIEEMVCFNESENLKSSDSGELQNEEHKMSRNPITDNGVSDIFEGTMAYKEDSVENEYMREYFKVLISLKMAAEKGIIIVMHESQYMDIESYILLSCAIELLPTLKIILFARSGLNNSYLRSKLVNSGIDRNIINIVYMEKLTRYCTNVLLGKIWPFSDEVKGITSESLNALFDASMGSPNYVYSIVNWIKSTAQWKLRPGKILEFNFGQMTGSIDNFDDIIRSQFDRLGPNFRLILKVTAVASPDLTFDDIYRLIAKTDRIDKFGLKPNNAKRNMKILKKLDRYNFLEYELYGGELLVKFNSFKVQNIIYDNIVASHRVLLDNMVAKCLYKKFKDNNIISTLWYTIMYQKKSGIANIELLVKNIEILARNRTSCLSIGFKIELYDQIISFALSKHNKSATFFSSRTKWRASLSHWYNKKAKLYIIWGNYDMFTKCIMHSLCILGCTPTKYHDGICTYCGTEINADSFEIYYPTCYFASIMHQKIKDWIDTLNIFINHPPQDYRRRRMPSLTQNPNTVDSVTISLPHLYAYQAHNKKQNTCYLNNIEKQIQEYVVNVSNEYYFKHSFSKSKEKDRLPLEDIQYVDKIFNLINKEDHKILNYIILNNIASYVAIYALTINKKYLEPYFSLLMELLKIPDQDQDISCKYYAVAALACSIDSKNIKKMEYYISKAIETDNMKDESKSYYIVINIIHSLFYTGLWDLCETVDSIYFVNHSVSDVCYTEQNIFYSILNFIRLFYTGPISKIENSISQLYINCLRLSNSFAGFYNNAFLELYSLVQMDQKYMLFLPSNFTKEKKEDILQISIDIYTEMRYNENPDIVPSIMKAIDEIKNKKLRLSPIIVFSEILILICYLAFLIRNPTCYKEKRYKPLKTISRSILRLFNNKNKADNLDEMNRPLFSLCQAIMGFYRKGPNGAIKPLMDIVYDRNNIRYNTYIRAAFSSFLIALNAQVELEDNPQTLFSEIGMTYHSKYGMFCLGII